MNKKIKFGYFLPLMLIGSLSFASTNSDSPKEVYININSQTGVKLLKSELTYRKYFANEAEQSLKIKRNSENIKNNNCEINKLKKIIIKLIKKEEEEKKNKKISKESYLKNLHKAYIKTNKFKDLKKIPISYNEKKKVCITKYIPVIKGIEGSYFKYKTDKTFTVTYPLAGYFKYPILKINREGLLYKGDKFVSDMYTKAGWVHIKNKGWIKGYKIYPRVINKVTKEDIMKWTVKYNKKIICN